MPAEYCSPAAVLTLPTFATFANKLLEHIAVGMIRIQPSKGYYRGNYFTVLIFRLLVALAFLWFSRVIFYYFNSHLFGSVTATETFHIFVSGLRFDVAALFSLNFPFIIAMTIPLPFRRYKGYKVIADLVYYVPNLLGISVNIIDVVYFRFTQKRMTGDVFDFVAAGVPMDKLAPQFIRDFWPFMLVFIVLAVIFILIVRRIEYNNRRFTEGLMPYYFYQVLSFTGTLLLSVILIRGGIQLKPINIITAIQYVPPSNLPLILNTPFTIIKTIDHQVIRKLDYYDPATLETIYSPVFEPEPALPDTNLRVKTDMNVVVLIMEGLSSEHTGTFNRHVKDYQGFTPFLDSLMQHSLYFNGFANAKQSIEGLPAITASIPGLMDRPFITSAFGGNSFNGMAGLLRKKGYQTSFFHGGTNGTMDFDRFALAAGFQRYFGRTEYNNDADFDGRWGIFDEPFLQYFARNLNQMPEPFLSVFFSLSAHHPYTIPAEHQGRFTKGKLQIQEAIMYSDYALKRFFETARTMDWYQNTLFVITADHTSEASLPEFKSRVGMYRIPIVFFSPGSTLDTDTSSIVSQADIMPSVLSMLDYDEPFVAFGNNIFAKNQPTFAVMYINGVFQMVQNDFLIEFDGMRTLALYNFVDDPLMRQNLVNQEIVVKSEMEKLIKAYIQQYFNRLIENRMTAR